MLRWPVFFLSLLLLLPLAVSQEADRPVSVTDLSVQLGLFSNQVVGSELPGFAKTLFGNEQVNIYIALGTGEQLVFGLVTKKGKVEQLGNGKLSKPTLNVYITEEILQKIIAADDPPAAFQDALKNKELTYQAVGLRKKIKFSFLSLVARWFA